MTGGFWQLCRCCASLIIAFLASGCESEYERAARAVEKPLEWVETANAARSFNADVASGRLHFLGVCAGVCVVPGVSRLNAQRCYPTVPVENVPGTTHAFLSDRQIELQGRVMAFSREYNLLVASSARAKGMSACKGKEDWDAGFSALSAALETLTGVTDFRSGGSVTLAKNSTTFDVVLARELPLKPFEEHICAVMGDHGLSTAAKVRYRVDANEKDQWQEISCGGEIQT